MTTRTVLLTGASSGIGRALALELAARGARLAIAARRADELDRLARHIAERGGSALPMPLDVCDAAAVADAVRRADRDLGALDMVIANAGVGYYGHASTMSFDDVTRLFDVNVRGAMATICAAIPIFLAQQRGHIVGVTSLAGRRGLPKSGPYSASKAALSILLETLRVDLADAGIRVTDVQPGFVETPMTAKHSFKMPFMWTAEKAARHIARRLESAPATIAFPWQLAWVTALTRYLPSWIYDRAVRAATP